MLRADDNRLTWIDVDAFQSTPLLTELGLAENRLSEMTAGTLTPLTDLHQLSLDGNRFKVHYCRKSVLETDPKWFFRLRPYHRNRISVGLYFH